MLYDTLNFIRKLTLAKVYNIIKAKSSFYVARLYKKPIVWGIPYAYSIEPTGLCNLKCPECPTGKGLIKRKTTAIDPKTYASILEQISPTASYLMLYLQGEPFINPNIFDLIHKASEKGIYSCISTNGHFMDKQNAEQTVRSGLDRLIISLDGTTSETYSLYRKGGSFEVVLAGIKNLVEAKKQLKSQTPHLILQLVVFKHNQHQIKDFKLLGKSLGANKTVLKSAQLYDFELGNQRMTDLDKFSRYKKKGGNYLIKKKLQNQCKRLWTIGVVTSDGIMPPCCYDKNADFQMGDVTKTSLKNIWKGNEFKYYRKKVLTDRKSIDICSNCDE